MYFMPASFASFTHASASNFTGLNWVASCSYSFTGICARFMIHSPSPRTRFPFHSPAGIAYSPQWMNRPNFASRNHASRASRAGSAGRCSCARARAAGMQSRPKTHATRTRRAEGPIMISSLARGSAGRRGRRCRRWILERVLAGADVDDRRVSTLHRGGDTRRATDGAAALRHAGELRGGKVHGSASVRGNAHRHAHAAGLELPARRGVAVRGHQLGAGRGETATGLRLHHDVLEAGSGLVEIEASDGANHPVADRAVGVVIEGVHPDVLEALVRLLAVPALPDRRCALGDGIQPGRI